MNITFYGATDGVTGSKYLLEVSDKKILIDCGLFQGRQAEESLNWEEFPFDPKNVDAVIITHSHIDHIGLLAKLIKKGFCGPIYSTDATKDFTELFLPDSGEILKKVAKNLGKEELYNDDDVRKTIGQFRDIEYHKKTEIFPGVFVTLFDAGHILGSAIVKIEGDGKSIIFSGDLGNPPVPIIKDTEFIHDADYVVMESTYGDRKHETGSEREFDLEKIIEKTYTNNGVLLIPAFAMERTQELLFEIRDLISSNRIPKMGVFIDSPLAIKATEIYPKYAKYFDEEAKKQFSSSSQLFDFPELKMVSSVEESKAIDANNSPKIIIAGSGMSTGGRILFHERVFLSGSNNTLLIIGYQVEGSLGRKLQNGDKKVNILGSEIDVNAKIETLNSYSAHADQPKLVYWLKQIQKVKKVFLIHGEEESKKALEVKIKDEIGFNTVIPRYKDKFEL